MASKATSTPGSGETRPLNPSKSPPSLSPSANPSPGGIASQNLSTMSASSGVQDDYRPPAAGVTPTPTEDSTDKPVEKREPVSVPVSSGSPQLSASKADSSSDDPVESGGYSPSAMDKISRILQCVIIRTPHAFFAMMLTYGECYVLNKESFGYDAALFVGIAGAVYNIFSAFSWEIIPNYQLSKSERNGTLWRNLINLTNTCFITTVFTSAVWKLPEISSIQGFLIFGANYGLTYLFLKQFHPNIYKQPSWAQQRLE